MQTGFERTMNTKQCVKCDYWRTGNGGAGSEKEFKFCHHLLITGKCRERNGDECYSRKLKR